MNYLFGEKEINNNMVGIFTEILNFIQVVCIYRYQLLFFVLNFDKKKERNLF